MTETPLNPVGKGQRILHVIFDTTTFLTIWANLTNLLLFLGLGSTYIDETGQAVSSLPLFILVPTYWGYYLISEYVFQKTIAKLLTKTKVVSLSGDKPTFKQILIRTLCRSIPFEYFSF